jgi:signal transduction histidine kinase
MSDSVFSRWRVLFEPMMIAAHVTLLAVLLTVWRSGVTDLLPFSASAQQALALGSLLLFTLLMVGCALTEKEGCPTLRPLPTLLQILAALVVTSVSKNTVGPVLLIIVMAELAGVLSWQRLAPIFVIVNLAVMYILALRWGWADAGIASLSFGGFQLFAVMTTTYAKRAQSVSAELQQVNAHLLATRTLLAESARDQERLRISRELHDVAGHKLTAMKLHLLALARDPRMQQVAEVGTCAQLADELLGDIREVVKQMRAHDGMSLAAAIEQIAQAMPRPQAHIDVEAEASVGNALQAEALLRAVQEAITNAARHGNAENIWIVLRRRGDRIELDVRDDGRGVGAVRFGNGLSGMRERIEALGGDLQPATSPGRGFALHAWIPAT